MRMVCVAARRIRTENTECRIKLASKTFVPVPSGSVVGHLNNPQFRHPVDPKGGIQRIKTFYSIQISISRVEDATLLSVPGSMGMNPVVAGITCGIGPIRYLEWRQ